MSVTPFTSYLKAKLGDVYGLDLNALIHDHQPADNDTQKGKTFFTYE